MSQLLHSKESWNIAHGGALCGACGAAMEPGQACWAALVENSGSSQGAAPVTASPSEVPAAATSAASPASSAPATAAPRADYQRMDYCEACWAAGKRPEAPSDMFSYWKTAVPVPTQKRKLFVDDSVLLDLFGRLEGKPDPMDVRFRFVLALVLMRKRLLKYEGMETGEKQEAGSKEQEGGKAPEIWTMVPRGENAVPVLVINPQLTPEQVGEVSGQLSQILAEEI